MPTRGLSLRARVQVVALPLTFLKESLDGLVKLLSTGRVHLDIDWLQLQVKGCAYGGLQIPCQALQVDVQQRHQLNMLLVGGDLQLMPELCDLQSR